MVARGLAQPLRSSGTSVRVAKVTPARVSARRDLQRSSNDLEPEIGGINQRSGACTWVVSIDANSSNDQYTGVLYAAE